MSTTFPSKLETLQVFLFKSQHRFARVIRLAMVGLIALIAWLRLVIAYLWLLDARIYKKDIIQEYVLARALKAGINPLKPLPELVDLLIGKIPIDILSHPTPHPLINAFVFYPFAWVSYHQAAYIWFVIEILLIAMIAIQTAFYMKGKKDLGLSFLVFIVLLSWFPFALEMGFGQLNILITFLLFQSLFLFRKNKSVLSGILLGMAIAIKLYAWPIWILLFIKRKFKPILFSVITFLLANFITGLIFGFDLVRQYYLEVGPAVAGYYKAYAYNYSLSTIGWRLFSGTVSPIFPSTEAPPLIDSPWLAGWISFLLPLAFLLIMIYAITKIKDFDLAFGFSIVMGLLINPSTWGHNLVLLIIPLVIYLKHLATIGYPAHRTLGFLIYLAVFYLFQDINVQRLVAWTAGIPAEEVERSVVPTLSGLITYIPTVLLLILVAMIYRAGTQPALPSVYPEIGLE